jgi:hypothetical protein
MDLSQMLIHPTDCLLGQAERKFRDAAVLLEISARRLSGKLPARQIDRLLAAARRANTLALRIQDFAEDFAT